LIYKKYYIITKYNLSRFLYYIITYMCYSYTFILYNYLRTKLKMLNQYCKLLNVSRNTFYVHKRENRLILHLLEKYFTDEELEEFLKDGKIKKFDEIDFLQKNIIESSRIKYLKSFILLNPYHSLSSSHNSFISFYFDFLMKLKDDKNDKSYFFIENDFYHYDIQLLLNQHLLNRSINKTQDDMLDKFKAELLTTKKENEELCKDMKLDLTPDELEKETIEDVKNELAFPIIHDYYNLHKHFVIFKDWDLNMMFFLNKCLESDFEILIDDNDEKKYQEEALYHIEKYKALVG